ncbi:hypothetical protein Tco_0775122 [Tanacetum coccineum]
MCRLNAPKITCRLNTPIIDECHFIGKREQQTYNRKAMKARLVKVWDVKGRNPILSYVGRIRKMSQSLSNNVPDNSPEQEAATGHSIPRRIDSPTSQATRLPELGLTLTPATGHDITFSNGKPAFETSELNPEDVTARLEDLEVEVDTLHADIEDKELLISELQDILAAAENEIALLQIRVTNVEDRHAEDHEQIQKILARLSL